jgi:hypothetical protein
VTVQVGELHTEVSMEPGSAPPGTTGAGHQTAPADSAEERALEAQCRARWLAERVAAGGFDD